MKSKTAIVDAGGLKQQEMKMDDGPLTERAGMENLIHYLISGNGGLTRRIWMAFLKILAIVQIYLLSRGLDKPS